FLLGKFLKVDSRLSSLISCGTSICGGSAIAAAAHAVRAEPKQIAVSLGIVFILNSIALFLFPWAGHLLGMSQQQFGIWAA
ncbi:putative sulfate exporter family transporter, partial [Escherichia coli]|nr:putative sulfate exporter family transporter [Escherichia coli]